MIITKEHLTIEIIFIVHIRLPFNNFQVGSNRSDFICRLKINLKDSPIENPSIDETFKI